MAQRSKKRDVEENLALQVKGLYISLPVPLHAKESTAWGSAMTYQMPPLVRISVGGKKGRRNAKGEGKKAENPYAATRSAFEQCMVAEQDNGRSTHGLSLWGKGASKTNGPKKKSLDDAYSLGIATEMARPDRFPVSARVSGGGNV